MKRICWNSARTARRALVLSLMLAPGAPSVALAQAEPPHPILSIPGSANTGSANNIVNNFTETQYTNNFVPRQSPRNNSYGFVPPVVSGDTGWSWSSSTPNQITSTPSGTVFPTTTAYTAQTQAVLVTSGKTVQMPFYIRAGSSTGKSMVFELINHNKRGKLRSDLNVLAPTYMASGSTHATRNQAYARRIAIALLDWARHVPDYVMTGKNSATYIDAGPGYVLASDLQRGSDHNGLAHEWTDDELFAFDAIYDSPALAQLSTELGFDVRQYITDNLFCNFGDFFKNRVPINVATSSNLSHPYTVLALVARVLNRPDYIHYMDDYLDATVTKKIWRDGTLSEGMGYSIGYINENLTGARNTRNYFISRPANTPELQAISERATNYVKVLEYGQAQWRAASLPNGQLPSFGDTPFNNYFSARNTGTSVLLPAYGSVSLGIGNSSGTAVQLNQIFAGDNNHMRSDTTAYVLWAFGNEVLGNVRYHNGTPGRQFTEQILAYNAVTIDRGDMNSTTANTFGTGDLTLYEPGNNGFAATEIDGLRAYYNRASRYQRIMVMNTVDTARPYVVDVFRVTGGTTHDYVWHGSIRYDQTAQSSFPLVTNTQTYPMLEGSEVWTEPTSSGSSFPYYGFWRNVNSNTAPGNFNILYRDVSRTAPRDTKLWMTASPSEFNVYLGRTPVPARANGEPANWWVNGLWRPSTIIRKRIPSGTLHDLFVSVIEPLNNGVSAIQSVERLPMAGATNESAALRITFADGRVDTCIVNLRNPEVANAGGGSATVATADGGYVLAGRIGFHVDRPSSPRVWTMHATDFQYPGRRFTTPATAYSGWIAGETRKLEGGAYDAFTTTTPLPLGTALRGKQLSVTFGTLSSGTIRTNISQMFQIDQVVLTNGLYHVTFTNDHLMEITNGVTTVEQVAPLRRFTTSNSFEIVMSAHAQQISPLADIAIAPGGSSGPINFTFGNLGGTAGASLQVLATSANQSLIPNGNLALGGSGTSRTLTINASAGQTGSSLITVSVSDGLWTNSHSFTAFVDDFALSVTPASQTILAGGSASYTATITATNGFSEVVNFGISGLPANAGASFNPATLSGAGSVTLNVFASNSVAPGTYPLTVTATAGDLSDTNTVTLVINTNTPTPGVANWTGGSPNNNFWSDPANWGSFALNAGDSLNFAGNNRLENTNNTTALTAYNGITFKPDSGSFMLNGNAVTLTGGVANNSPNSQTIALGLNFNSSLTFNGGAGGLRIGGGWTNTANSATAITTTLAGLGTVVNNLSAPTSTNIFLTSAGANWTIVDNPSSTPVTLTGALNIFNGGTLNFGTEDSAPTLTLAGNDSTGAGQRHNIGNATGTSALNIVNGTLTFPNRINVGNGTAGAALNVLGGTLSIGGAGLSMSDNNIATTGSVTVNGGWLRLTAGTFYVSTRGTGTLTVNDGLVDARVLDVCRAISSGGSSVQGTVNLNGGVLTANRVGTATANSAAGGSPTAVFNFNGGTLKATAASTTWFLGSLAGGSTPLPITANVKSGGAIIDDGGFAVTIGEPLRHDPALGGDPDGGLTKLNGGTVTLAGTNTYNGKTMVAAGTLALIGNAWISNSVLVDVAAGAVLDANGRNDAKLTLVSGQKLAGNGTLNGHVTINSGATLAPGVPPAGVQSGGDDEEEEDEEGGGEGEDPEEPMDVDPIGALTFNHSLTLTNGSTTVMELSAALETNDVAIVAGTLTYGGTLSLSGVSGLSASDSFKLFHAANYTGAFTEIVPETPGPGLAWNTNTLATDGTLRIDSIAPPQPPQISGFEFRTSSSEIVLRGSNGVPGASFYVLATTNISLPVSNWTRVLTNLFDENGGFTVTNPPGDSVQQYYLLQLP